MLEPIDADRLADEVSRRYPYPLAATYHRAYFEAIERDEAHDYLLDLFELTLKYTTTIVLSQYFADNPHDPRINRGLLSLQRPSLGHWLGWLRDILDLYRREHRDLRIPELATVLNQKNSSELHRASSTLRQIMTERMGYDGGTRNTTSTTPLQFLQLLVEYRNKLAHGVRAGRHDREQIATILLPALRELFATLSFLAEYRLVYVNEVKVEWSGGQGDPHVYAHQVTYLTGDRPRVSQKLQILPNAPARAREVYLLDKTAEFQPLLSLHPFLILRYCEHCNREQVFVLNLSTEKAADYLSYPCTHHFSPTEYLDDMRSILGKLDPSIQTTNGETDDQETTKDETSIIRSDGDSTVLDPVDRKIVTGVDDGDKNAFKLENLKRGDQDKSDDQGSDHKGSDLNKQDDKKGKTRRDRTSRISQIRVLATRAPRVLLAGVAVLGLIVVAAIVLASPSPSPSIATPTPPSIATPRSTPVGVAGNATGLTTKSTSPSAPASLIQPTVSIFNKVSTPFPEYTSTPIPVIGARPRDYLYFRDTFNDPNSGFYKSSNEPSKYELGYAKGEYRMAWLKAPGYVYTLLDIATRGESGSPTITDFTVEVGAHLESANPDGSYAILFRYQDVKNYYSFVVRPGTRSYEIVKLVGGKETDLVPWTTSDLINTGVTTNVLKVFANGPNLDVMVNGTNLTSTSDESFASGKIGLQTIAWTQPTVARFGKLVVTKPNILYYDDFTDSTSGFPTSSTIRSDASLAYQHGAYAMALITAPGRGSPGSFIPALLNLSFRLFDNFALDVDAQLTDPSVDGAYGVMFRAADDRDYYAFEISPSTSAYKVIKTVNGTVYDVTKWTISPAIHRGLAPNHLRLIAQRGTLSLFVNGMSLTTVTDETYSVGKLGLIIADWTDPVSARFANLAVSDAP